MGFLSSQPRRNWGSDNEENVQPPPAPSFELTAEEWPPTPPKPVKATSVPVQKGVTSSTVLQKRPSTSQFMPPRPVARTSDASKPPTAAASSTKLAGSSAPSNARRQSTTTQKKQFLAQTAAPVPAQRLEQPRNNPPRTDLAPVFAPKAAPKQATKHDFPWANKSKNVNKLSWPLANNVSQSSTATPAAPSSSSATVIPKKRVMPWDTILDSSNSTMASGSSSAPTISNFHAIGGGSDSKGPSRMLTSTSASIKQKILLSPEQLTVLKLVAEDGLNVFFTGSAGTGKSVLLREIIATLRRKYHNQLDAIAVTASTGMAACNVGGTTIHSFAGIGTGTDSAAQLIGKVKKNRNALGKWKRAKVLIIDEISMVDAVLFDKLDEIAKAVRTTKGQRVRPFGGLQLVVTGDFFQLPPVTKGTSSSFAFDARAWKEAITHTVNLTQVFRQKDTRFIDMLNELRFGQLSEPSIAVFKSLSRLPPLAMDLEPTELFSLRNEVERANLQRLQALHGDERVFHAVDDVKGPPGQTRNSVLDNVMAPPKLVLKIGAQVMLVKNMDGSLVNGTIGKVIGFGEPDEALSDDELVKIEGGHPVKRRKMDETSPYVEWRTPEGSLYKLMSPVEFSVEDATGQKRASRRQVPIILAWAMSIHKSQGQTLPCVKVDLRRVFEKGQSYVALSRATCLDGLQVLNFDPKKVSAHPEVIKWSQSLLVVS